MTDTKAIQICFCPPMDDPSDPEQHEIPCLARDAIRMRQFLDANNLIPVAGMLLRRDAAFPLRNPIPRPSCTAPPAIPSGCYEASFGWVHVRPGCHCPERAR